MWIVDLLGCSVGVHSSFEDISRVVMRRSGRTEGTSYSSTVKVLHAIPCAKGSLKPPNHTYTPHLVSSRTFNHRRRRDTVQGAQSPTPDPTRPSD
jgi:hypothetical protein